MLNWLFKLPLVVALMAIGAVAMMVPAIYASVIKEWVAARAFLYSGVIFLVLMAMIALATSNRPASRPARAPLIDLLAAFAILPIMLAIPVWESVPGLSFTDAYFEMVSCLTTTGASVLEGSSDTFVYNSVHLWRALVGWLGGLLIWVTAVAILAPLSLGGFEVLGRTPVAYSASFSQIARTADTTVRLRHYTNLMLPIYTGLTLCLWILLYLLGDDGLVALSHAMSSMATSGISPIGGTGAANSGIGGEVLIAAFLIFALSRQTFTRDAVIGARAPLFEDRELRVGLVIAAVIPTLLFLRHWVGAIGERSDTSLGDGLSALWGGVFTVVSFLSTTGFQSASWATAQDWSGIGTPGLIFIGLALVGGGVATTAGGIKLLRVYVLFRHSQREVEKLIHPSSVSRVDGEVRSARRRSAFIAWIFFMLFVMSLAVVMMALSLTGSSFEESIILSVSALATTGPLAPMLTETPDIYAGLTDTAKLILVASMVLGRLETLAIISLLNPEFWRN